MPTELFAQKQASLVPSKESKKCRLNISPEERTKENCCKEIEEQNPQLTRSSLPVYQRFITETTSALSCWLLTSGPTPFCLCKPFSCKACPGKWFRIRILLQPCIRATICCVCLCSRTKSKGKHYLEQILSQSKLPDILGMRRVRIARPSCRADKPRMNRR